MYAVEAQLASGRHVTLSHHETAEQARMEAVTAREEMPRARMIVATTDSGIALLALRRREMNEC